MKNKITTTLEFVFQLIALLASLYIFYFTILGNSLNLMVIGVIVGYTFGTALGSIFSMFRNEHYLPDREDLEHFVIAHGIKNAKKKDVLYTKEEFEQMIEEGRND